MSAAADGHSANAVIAAKTNAVASAMPLGATEYSVETIPSCPETPLDEKRPREHTVGVAFDALN